MTPLAAAISLADQCIPSFPCRADKAPLSERGFLDATVEHTAGAWASAALVGIPTGAASGINVLDVDVKGGGLDWLAENEHRLPATRRVRTRSGGWHIYFKDNPDLRCSVSKVAPGVDTRCAGGYVIDWAAAGMPVRDGDTLVDWPAWLFDLAQGSRVRHAANPNRSASDLAPPDAATVVALLERMPNPDGATRDDYVKVMLASKGCIDGLDDTDAAHDIAHAAISWACRWAGSLGWEVEESKWNDDFATRTAPLAGWGNLLAAAQRLGVDTAGERMVDAALEFGSTGLLADVVPSAVEEYRPALLEITEDAAALAFAEKFHQRFVYDHTNKLWFQFDPAGGWASDDCGAISRVVRDFVRESRVCWGSDSSKNAAKIAFSSAVERGCQCDSRFAVTSRVWDSDPFVLGVPGGSVDLRTGVLAAAEPGRYVLRRTTVAPAPAGTVPATWLRFLQDATGGDAALQAWLQRLLGYALTGDVSEEMLAFIYGPGGNGKGVTLHTISSIFGDYAYSAPAELFKADSRTNREYQLARLDGIRLLLANETEAGADLAESFVKELTGNEGKINARHPYGRPFEFRPQAKLIIVGNHAPKLNGRSPAMERRLRVVPFNRKPAHPDLELKDKLVAEYPAILRWLIDGCLAWQRDRLGTAPAISEASAEYFTEQDTTAEWIAERCDLTADARDGATALLGSYNGFLRGRGERSVAAGAFKEALCGMDGITAKRAKTGIVFCGIRLRPVEFSDIL